MASINDGRPLHQVQRTRRPRAAQNGRSAEGEAQDLQERALEPGSRPPMGEALAALGSQAGLTDVDVATLDRVRDTPPAEPPSLA